MALGVATSGCYLSRQAAGQADILLNDRPVAEVLHDPAVRREQRRNLRVLLAAKRFGVKRLGMEEGATLYCTWYDTGDDPVAWNVTACEKDRFEAKTWWFPVVGTVPYLGFFHEPDATALAEELEDDEDLDVLKRGVGAYSTLGWFDDPVFSSALEGEAYDTARLVLHEMAHAVVFFPGEVRWNENFATLVGDRGVIAFFEARYGLESPRVLQAKLRQLEANVLGARLDFVLGELNALYASQLPRPEKLRLRQEIFDRGKASLRTNDLAASRVGKRWLERPWNNALFMSWKRYRGGQAELEAILDGRFKGDMKAFLSWLRTLSAPPSPPPPRGRPARGPRVRLCDGTGAPTGTAVRLLPRLPAVPGPQ